MRESLMPADLQRTQVDAHPGHTAVVTQGRGSCVNRQGGEGCQRVVRADQDWLQEMLRGEYDSLRVAAAHQRVIHERLAGRAGDGRGVEEQTLTCGRADEVMTTQ